MKQPNCRRVLVTGAAGFIGFHTARRMLAAGDLVLGVDNLNSYYDPKLKEARLALLELEPGFSFRRLELANGAEVMDAFASFEPEIVVHLGAQAGVRYSLENPTAYGESNLLGFLQVLEGSRRHRVKHLVYASTSSVYGANTAMPFEEHVSADHPLTLYAATKRANELMAHSYSHLFGLPTTGLRFFTVYGPWGRPDMAYFSFVKRILSSQPIEVFNRGDMKRDFTYVDDVVEGIFRVAASPASSNCTWDGGVPDPASSLAPWRLYNIGNSAPVGLLDFITLIERCLGRKAVLQFRPMQPGDVPATWASVEELSRAVGYAPETPVEEGVRRFVEWYLDYFKISGSRC